MTPLLAEQARTLQRLSDLWTGRRFVLVGATAVGCWMDMRWRATADVDLAVGCEFDEYPCGLSDAPGWSQGRHEHQWNSPDGVRIDVLPAGPGVLEVGSITWSSGAVMSLAGFRLAFEQAVAREDLAPRLLVNVAPLHVLVLLKMASYLDRPSERERDLDDLVHVLRDGIALDQRITEETIEAQVDFDVAGAFILGRRLHGVVRETDRQVVDAFLASALSEQDRNPTRDRMLALLSRRQRDADDDVLALQLRQSWEAYARGFRPTP